MYKVITYKWVIPEEYYGINDLKLSTNAREFESLNLVWTYLDSPAGQAAEGVQVFDENNAQIFALNSDVQHGPQFANNN